MTITPTKMRRKYEPRIMRLFKLLSEVFAQEGYHLKQPDDWTGDEYSWNAVGHLNPDETFDVTITISEGRFHDEGPDGLGVNFSMSIVESGGIIIGGITPYNYSDDVWVSRKDPEAVDKRWRLFENGCDPYEVVTVVVNHFLERATKS